MIPGEQGPEENPQDDKRSAVLNLIQDVKTQREDIDKIMGGVNQIADKLTQIGAVVDAQTKIINQLTQGGSVEQTPGNPGAPNQQGIESLLKILESPLGDKLLNKIIPNEQTPGPAPLISNEDLQQKMKDSFFDNLETGESITKFIKDSLKKNVTKKIINSSLADITRTEPDPHGPA